MKRKNYLVLIVLIVAIVVVVLLWLIIQKPSPEENLFATYQAETVDFRHPDDLGPNVLPPTPEGVLIYDIKVKSYDFNPEQATLEYETRADNNEWCRIKPLTSHLWAYYFEDYHQELRWENGERWNPDFNDVIVLVWNVGDKLKMNVIGSPSTFRNELWVGGQRIFDNVSAHLDEVFETPVPTRLR